MSLELEALKRTSKENKAYAPPTGELSRPRALKVKMQKIKRMRLIRNVMLKRIES